MLDATPLSETESKKYEAGLKDASGTISFPALLTNEVIAAWEGAVSAYAELTGGKQMWFCVVHPNLTKAVYLPGEPIKLGMSAMDVDSILTANLRVAPHKAAEWFEAPTT